MSIIIVAGPTCAGKSTFIKENFADREIVDLFDFQENIVFFSTDSIMRSYEECRDALIQKIKEGKQVVLEHTLLKAIRRKFYIDAIREITNEPIEIYFLIPEREIYREQLRKRKQPTDDDFIDSSYSILEIPTKEEGYDKVTVIQRGAEQCRIL